MPLKEMREEIRRLRRSFYTPPLSKKRQRVQAKAQRPGRCVVFTEEQIFLEKMRRAAKIMMLC